MASPDVDPIKKIDENLRELGNGRENMTCQDTENKIGVCVCWGKGREGKGAGRV